MKLLLPPGSVSPRLEATYGFEGLRFEELTYVSGLFLPPHDHPEAYLDFCLQGTIQEIEKKRTLLRGPATLNFMPVGAHHSTRFEAGARTFQIVLKAQWLERVRQFSAVADTPAIYENGPLNWIATRMYREFQHQDNLSPLALEGMLLELFAEMSRHSTTLAGNECPRWLRQARDFLHAHFTESFSMEAVATAVGVHPSHLMRGFRQRYRCTIGDYVRRLRVEYACHLLSVSETPLAQVAHAAGFADQSHFNQTFKGFMGMTPAEYRKASGPASLTQEIVF